jgi:cyanate permease
MTTIAIVPTGYKNDSTDYLRVKCDRSGAVRNVAGTVSVPSGTTANSYVGLVPFRKGARFVIGDKSVHCGNFGAGTTTVNLGVVYADSTTDDPDAFASLSTAAQSGGFITVDEIEGMTLTTPTDGWLAVQVVAADADATANITFNVGVVYDA